MRQAIHAAELAIERVVQGVVLGRARGLEIEWQQRRLRAAGLDDLVIAAFELAQRAAEQAHGRALARERKCHGLADAVAGAGHDHDAALWELGAGS